MKWTATCPSCKKETGILSVALALTPFSFKCGKCRARLYVKGVTLLIMTLLALMGVLSIVWMQILFKTGKFANQQYVYFLGPMFIIIALEVFIALIICNKAKLELKKKKK